MENKSMETVKSKKPNAWLEHVKAIREKTPDASYKEILQLARESYKPVEKIVKTKKSENLE